MAKTEREQAIRTLAKAHTSLCLFEKAAVMLEGSDIATAYRAAAQDIVDRCRAIQQKCLRDYDAAVAAAKK